MDSPNMRATSSLCYLEPVVRVLGNNLSEKSSNQTDTDAAGDVTNTTRTDKQ